MGLDANDIPDDEVRDWYIRQQPIGVCDIEQFAYLFDTAFRTDFFKGYEEYCNLRQLDNQNTYWKRLIKISVSPFITSFYQLMSESEFRQLILSRFALIEKMKQGFDPQYPIRLFALKYSSNTKTLTTKEGKQISYDAIDGYHRIVIARHHNYTEVPVREEQLRLGRRNSGLIAKHMNHTDNWYQPIDFGFKNNFDMFNFQNSNDNLNGIGKYEFALKEHLGDLENQTVIDLGCNSGVITAAIARAKPKLVIGIDREPQIKNALYVMGLLWKDYANLSFHILDITNVSELLSLCRSVQLDCVLASNVIYYLGDHVDDVIEVCAMFARKIVLQGNCLKVENGCRITRSEYDSSYRGEYSQIEPMKDLLLRHGFRVQVHDFENYRKPVVVGEKN